MFSRFLNCWIFSWMIFAALLFSSCKTIPTTQATEERHYIEPPRQQKIPAATDVLRVCADPNNLPFSNIKGEGFENKIASLVGKELNLPVEYTWWAQRRGFFRNTLRAGVCDVVMGVPDSFEMAMTTRSYYRSTYVFVSRADHGLNVHSLDDAVLKEIKIGVQMVGDDFANTPPAHALTNRGIVKNVAGYTMYGDYKQNNPPARIIDAVVKKEVDIAIVWGPLAGYFARKQAVPLRIEQVSPQIDLPYLPFVFDISMGVRRGEDDLKSKLDEIIVRKQPEIEKILDEYGIPRASGAALPAAVRRPEVQ